MRHPTILLRGSRADGLHSTRGRAELFGVAGVAGNAEQRGHRGRRVHVELLGRRAVRCTDGLYRWHWMVRVAGVTNEMTKKTITLTVLLLGCGPGMANEGGDTADDTWSEFGDGSGDGDGDGDYGDSGAENDTWAEIRCFELAADITTCAGRPHGSEDAWVLVVPECDVQDSDIDAWMDDTCASGSSPNNFLPESLCYWSTTSSSSKCFSGGDGWFTQIMPKCDAPVGPVVAWPSWQCDGGVGPIGQHPWDAVLCSVEPSSACTAIDNNDAMLTWPTCWVVAWPTLPVPTC